MTQTIMVATVNTAGLYPVDAEIIGPFAVHRTVGRTVGTGTYTLTHLFTGAVVINGVSNGIACSVAAELNALDDWYFGWIDFQPGGEYVARVKQSHDWLRHHRFR